MSEVEIVSFCHVCRIEQDVARFPSNRRNRSGRWIDPGHGACAIGGQDLTDRTITGRQRECRGAGERVGCFEAHEIAVVGGAKLQCARVGAIACDRDVAGSDGACGIDSGRAGDSSRRYSITGDLTRCGNGCEFAIGDGRRWCDIVVKDGIVCDVGWSHLVFGCQGTE